VVRQKEEILKMATSKTKTTAGSKLEAFIKMRDAAKSEVLAEIAELEQQLEEKRSSARELGFIADAVSGRARRAVGKRVCKICGQPGHNARRHKGEKTMTAAK
jgi:hypothetical protein